MKFEAVRECGATGERTVFTVTLDVMDVIKEYDDPVTRAMLRSMGEHTRASEYLMVLSVLFKRQEERNKC